MKTNKRTMKNKIMELGLIITALAVICNGVLQYVDCKKEGCFDVVKNYRGEER